MTINQSISKEEMSDILLNVRKQDKATSISAKFTLSGLYFADFVDILLLIFSIKIRFYFISALLIGSIIAGFISIKRIKAEAVKRQYSDLLESFIASQPDAESYTISADDNSITVNDTLSLKWADISYSELFKSFIICVNKNNLAFPIKFDGNLKSEVCNVLNNNNIDIISIYSNKSDKEFTKRTKRRKKKKDFLFRAFNSITVTISHLVMIVVFIAIVSQSKKVKIEDFDPIYYNPQEEIVTQMASAFDATRNADPTFDLYYHFISNQDYNTLIKMDISGLTKYKTEYINLEIYFFDGEEYNYGLKFDSSLEPSMGNITYTTADKSVHIVGHPDGTFITDTEKTDYSTWKNKFFSILEIDKSVLDRIDDYTMTNWGEITFHANWDDNANPICFNYGFSPINVVRRSTKSDVYFIIMFSKNDEVEIEKIKSIYEQATENSLKTDFKDLTEVMYNFAVEKTDEYIATVRKTH